MKIVENLPNIPPRPLLFTPPLIIILRVGNMHAVQGQSTYQLVVQVEKQIIDQTKHIKKLSEK